MLLAVNVVVAMLAGAPPAPPAPPQFGFSVAAMGDNMVLQQAPAAVSDRLIRIFISIYISEMFFLKLQVCARYWHLVFFDTLSGARDAQNWHAQMCQTALLLLSNFKLFVCFLIFTFVQAAVYGNLGTGGTSVSVTVTETATLESYTVDATLNSTTRPIGYQMAVGKSGPGVPYVCTF